MTDAATLRIDLWPQSLQIETLIACMRMLYKEIVSLFPDFHVGATGS
jgi:hypothetical protein